MVKRNNYTIFILILMLLVLPLVLLLVKQRQEIRKRAAENDAVVLLGTSRFVTLAPGASVNGSVNITAGATSISAVKVNLVYDPNKVTVSNLSCGTKLATPVAPDNTPGNLILNCADLTENPVSNQIFTAVTFTVTASSSLGSTTISLGDLTVAKHGNTSVALNKLGGTLQISSAAAGSILNFFFGSSAVSPGGSNSGTVKITAGTTAVKSAQIVLSYDASKMTLSNLRCGSEFPAVGSPTYGTGTANITCGTPAGNDGIAGRVFDAALFDIQVLSTAPLGAATISFASNSGLVDRDNLVILTTLNPGTFQITAGATPTPTAVVTPTPTVVVTPTPTATPPPGTVTLNKSCVVPGESLTISGSGFGSSARFVYLTTSGSEGYCNVFGGCGVSVGSTSWSDSQIITVIPANTSLGSKVIAIFKVNNDTAILTPYFTVASSCVVATPTPTATPVVTPTPTTVAGGTPTPTPTATAAAAGNTFVIKLKFAFLNSKPTTPDVTGLDYEHHLARVTIKSGTTDMLASDVVRENVRMTVDSTGLWTSDPISLAGVPDGSYRLFIKPQYYFQKRFTNIALSSGKVINSSGVYSFEPGDVDSNGVVNLLDVTAAWNVILKARAAEEGGTPLVASDYRIDYDYNGLTVGGDTPGINAGDIGVILETLKTRYDDE